MSKYISLADIEIAQLESIQKFIDTVRLNPELTAKTINHLLNSSKELSVKELFAYVPLVVDFRRFE